MDKRFISLILFHVIESVLLQKTSMINKDHFNILLMIEKEGYFHLLARDDFKKHHGRQTDK